MKVKLKEQYKNRSCFLLGGHFIQFKDGVAEVYEHQAQAMANYVDVIEEAPEEKPKAKKKTTKKDEE